MQIVGGSLMTLAFRRWIRPIEERADAERTTGTTEEEQGAKGNALHETQRTTFGDLSNA